MKRRMLLFFYPLSLAALIFLAGAPQAFAGALAELEQELTALAETVKPGVVIVLKTPNGFRSGLLGRKVKPFVNGTGIIISPDGYLITNHHVVAGVEPIVIELSSGKRYTAKVIGVDRPSDIAVLKIDVPHALPYLVLSAEQPRIGQPAVAIGHSLGFVYSATFGIVTGLDRFISSPLVSFIQTDAAINPGNSGGPLFNVRGEVIGMNSIFINMAQNLGFAIPASFMRQHVPTLIANGKIRRGYLGIKMEEVREPGQPSSSVAVMEVVAGSPAGKAGIQKGDMLARVNEKKVESPFDVFKIITDLRPGTVVVLELNRPDHARYKASVILGELPED